MRAHCRSVTASAPSLDSSFGSRSSGPGRGADAPPAAEERASTRRANSSSNCGLRCSANPPTRSVAPSPSGSARTQTLRREPYNAGSSPTRMRIAAASTRGTPGSRATWNTEYCRSSGNEIVEPDPSSPSARAAPSARSAVRSAPTMPDETSSSTVESRRFVARSPSTPSQTVKRMIGSNSTSIACGTAPGSSSAANARLSGHSSSSIARSRPPAPAPGSFTTPRHGIANSTTPSGAGSRSITTGPDETTSPSTVTCTTGAHPKLDW